MVREDLLVELRNRAVDPQSYAFDGSSAFEQYVLESEGDHWLVYYAERGHKNDLEVFETEDAACRALLDLLTRDGAARSS